MRANRHSVPSLDPADVLYVLEYERRATGVDEWDESDTRCELYNACFEALGDERAYEVLGEVGNPDRLVRLDDVVCTLDEAHEPDAASVIREAWPNA